MAALLVPACGGEAGANGKGDGKGKPAEPLAVAVATERGALILATSVTGAALVVRSVVALTHGPAAWSLGSLDLWSWPALGPSLAWQLGAVGSLVLLGVLVQRRS